MWRGLDSLIALEDDPGFDQKKDKAPLRPANLSNLAALDADGYLEKHVFDVALVSMEYGPQESSVASTFSSTIGLPVVVLRDDDAGRKVRNAVRASAKQTYQAAISMGWFAGQLRVAAGNDYEFGVAAKDRFYAQLEPQFIEWMSTVAVDTTDESQKIWQKRARGVALAHARELLRGAGQKAVIGREIDAGEEGKGRIISAGSLYRQLLRLSLIHI